ncbi:MAG: TetR/AcrR family transcriptional regulator [Verrucomicrobia bacterium]|nr:TetR/AcrR family transcriptional regulator [Verrucomicrobiota bacterium]
MRRRTRSREVILGAAEAVVVGAGAAHLTLDAVAAKAGVSKGGLLYHFPSKESLLQGMLAHLLKRVDSDKAQFRGRVAARRSADLEAHILAGFHERPYQARVAAALLAAGANNLKLLAPVRQWQSRNFREMARSKRNPMRAAAIMMAIDGLWLNELLQTSPLSAKERKQLMLELVNLARSAA